MTTMVGKQSKFEDALYELCELDYDAIEAYQAAIERLEKKEYVEKLQEFKVDHQRHVSDITSLLNKHQAKAPTGPDAKQYLTKGKVILANLMGDEAILKAMLTNEEDTNIAYERLNDHAGKWEDSETILNQGLADEKKHKQWIHLTLNGYK